MFGRVILAHDRSRDASAVATLLHTHGYEMRQVHDGASLLSLADQWRPGAAVIDLGLQAIPALEAGSALRARFGGQIQLVGFTVPTEPSLEKHALDAGYDHVVLDIADAAEVLIAMEGPGATLVTRSQEASLEFAKSLVSYCERRMENHNLLREPLKRRRNIVMLRRAIEALARSMDMLDEEGRTAMKLQLAALEGHFSKMVES